MVSGRLSDRPASELQLSKNSMGSATPEAVIYGEVYIPPTSGSGIQAAFLPRDAL